MNIFKNLIHLHMYWQKTAPMSTPFYFIYGFPHFLELKWFPWSPSCASSFILLNISINIWIDCQPVPQIKNLITTLVRLWVMWIRRFVFCRILITSKVCVSFSKKKRKKKQSMWLLIFSHLVIYLKLFRQIKNDHGNKSCSFAYR